MTGMTDYQLVVVGTDGSELAGPTVERAAWLARRQDADLVIVCAYAEMSRRADAKNVATLGGDPRSGQVLGRGAASNAIAQAVASPPATERPSPRPCSSTANRPKRCSPLPPTGAPTSSSSERARIVQSPIDCWAPSPRISPDARTAMSSSSGPPRNTAIWSFRRIDPGRPDLGGHAAELSGVRPAGGLLIDVATAPRCLHHRRHQGRSPTRSG